MNKLWMTALALVAALSLSGCVSNRLYREHNSVVTVAARPALPSTAPGAKPRKVFAGLPPGGPCESLKRMPDGDPTRPLPSTLNPCLAFLEFDDLGRPWMTDPAGQYTQLERTKAMIEEAKRVDPTHQPVVVLFVHGWQHNAHESPDDDGNIQGLENTLDWLSTAYYGPNLEKDAQGHVKAPGHVVVGVYVAWRGALATEYWPGAQVVSYFNREDAAKRVGSAELSAALRTIATTTHTPYKDPRNGQASLTQPILFLIGHSFGALVLEKAVTPIFMQSMDEQRTRGDKQYSPIADLIVFVNSAAAATESKTLIDYVAREQIEYKPNKDDAKLPEAVRNQDWPLIVSITTPADAATGIALPVGHFISGVQFELKGSFRSPDPLTCFRPGQSPTDTGTTWVTDAYSQWHFWTTSAAHDKALQGYQDVILGMEPVIDATTQQSSCPDHKTDQFQPRAVGNQCIQTQRLPDPCTGAAYWVMLTDKSVLPSHSTIFTDRMIRLIAQFIPPALPPNTTLPPTEVPTITLQPETNPTKAEPHLSLPGEIRSVRNQITIKTNNKAIQP